ncbi:MAG: peptidase, partial [Caulobacteraceae bacterium]|nr:peptidase [Caulobacteraceae bacterium]
VTAQTSLEDLGAEQVTFANGVRLMVKPTKFTNDDVQVLVRIGAGLQSLPKTAPPMGWAEGALIAGGLKQISLEDMERVLSGKVWNADFTTDDDAFLLSGSATRDDFETEMQILAAYATEPGWRPEAFQRQKTYTLSIQDQMAATDGGVMGRDLPGLMHPGDRRFAYPSKDEIAAGSLDQLRAQIDPGLASGPIEITIVGDITVDQAIDLTAATFGALPPRRPANPPADQKTTAFPAGGGPVVVRTHTGRADQSTLLVAWKTGDFFSDINRARAMSVLGQVIELRLIDELRSRQGATYSPSAGSSASQIWPGWGNLSISMEVTPDRLDGVMASIDKIAADLAASPPTDDEMLRAKGPLAEGLEKSRQTNGYWVSTLSGGIADPRRLDAVRSVQAGLQRVTAAEVQQAARTYLTPGNEWRMQVKPAGS